MIFIWNYDVYKNLLYETGGVDLYTEHSAASTILDSSGISTSGVGESSTNVFMGGSLMEYTLLIWFDSFTVIQVIIC